MGRRGVIALILLATFASGCGPGGGKPDSGVAPADAWVELGTGTTSFQAVAADSELPLIAGPQGGHHFILHARMRGLEPGDPTMPGTIYNPSTRFTVWSEDGEQLDIDPPAYRLGYEEVEDGVYALLGGHIIQLREELVTSLYGVRVKVQVEIEDSSGARVRDERWIVAVEDTSVPGGDAGVPDAGPPPAWVEIGTGIEAWEPILNEGDLELYAGPQGGHHFFVRSRMTGLNPGDSSVPGSSPRTVFAAWSEDGVRLNIATAALRFRYDEVGDGVYEMAVAPYDLRIIESEYPGILGDRVRVTVELTDYDGLQVTDERWVNVVEP